MLKTSSKFFMQVVQEFKKITWSTKKQALSVTGIVFVMVFITALYFFALDWILSSVVNLWFTIWG